MIVEGIDQNSLLNFGQKAASSGEVTVEKAARIKDSRPVLKETAKPDQEKEKSEDVYSAESIDNAIDSMGKVVSIFNTHLSFAKHEDSGKTVIKIVNNETEEVIRQIPPETMLNAISKMRDIIGILFDQAA
jgi:flagellar protein FlaG